VLVVFLAALTGMAAAIVAAIHFPLISGLADTPSAATPSTSRASSTTATATQQSGTVSRVVDGDTIDVQETGRTVRVRVLGVNAPEIAHDGTPAQCYGPEATARARGLALGKPVTLTSDPTQPATDRNGRQLRCVAVAGTDLGQLLLDGGFAREYHLSSEGPTQRTASYLAAQNTARTQRIELWGACPSL